MNGHDACSPGPVIRAWLAKLLARPSRAGDHCGLCRVGYFPSVRFDNWHTWLLLRHREYVKRSLGKSTVPRRPGRPAAGRLLLLLKNRGPQTAGQLGKALRVTGEAARQQLEKLAAEGLVEATPSRAGVGRPSKTWSITPPRETPAFPIARGARRRSHHGDEAGIRPGRARPAAGTCARSNRSPLIGSDWGTAAPCGHDCSSSPKFAPRRDTWPRSWKRGTAAFLLVENHCPICVAATACLGLCGAELDVFQKVLGSDVAIERTEHILAVRAAVLIASVLASQLPVKRVADAGPANRPGQTGRERQMPT